MKTPLLSAGIGLLLGVALGVLIAGALAPTQRAPTATASGNPSVPTAPTEPGADPTHPESPTPARATAPMKGEPASEGKVAEGRVAADLVALRAEVTALQARAIAAERARDQLTDQLASERALREDTEGLPVDWPTEIPERYTADPLREGFNAALKELGYEGEVTEVDCEEYPCIVYGKVRDDDGTTLDQLKETQALAGYQNASNSTSAWGGKKMTPEGEKQEAVFGIALYPNEPDEQRRAQINKRLRFRHQGYWESATAR